MKFSNKDLIKKGYDVEKNKKLMISFNRMLSKISYEFEHKEKEYTFMEKMVGFGEHKNAWWMGNLNVFIEDIKRYVIIYDNKVCIFSNNTIIEEMGKEINYILNLLLIHGQNMSRMGRDLRTILDKKDEINEYTKRKDEFLLSLKEASRKAFLLGRMDLNIPKVIKDTIAENIALIENVAIELQSLK